MNESKFDISGLMEKPIYVMTGKEFVQLAEFALSSKPSTAPAEPLYVYGIQALAAERMELEPVPFRRAPVATLSVEDRRAGGIRKNRRHLRRTVAGIHLAGHWQ